MNKAGRPALVLAAAGALALGSVGTAWACDGTGAAAGSYPGESTSQAGDYPGSTTNLQKTAVLILRFKN